MNPRRFVRRSGGHTTIAAFLGFVILSSTARSATLTWDIDSGTPGITEGGGTWDNRSGSPLWFNGASTAAYIAGSDVVFGGGGSGTSEYQVSLSNFVPTKAPFNIDDIVANSITFNPGARYTLLNDTGDRRKITVTSGQVTVNVDAVILTSFSTTSLIKTGSGTLTFSNNNAHNTVGSAKISEGTIVLNRDSDLINGDVTINGGTVRYLQSGAIANVATVTLSAGKIDLTSKNEQITTLNMNGGTIDGTGTLLASTYNLSGGTVNAKLDTGNLNISGPVVLNNTKASGAMGITAGGVLTLGGANLLSSASPLTISGGGQLILNGNTAVQSIALNSGSITGTGDLTSASGITVSAGTIGVSLTGAGSLTKNTTDTVILSGNNSYSGQTTVSQGILQIGAGGNSGTFGSGSVSIATGASVVLNRGDNSLVVANAISGGGKVIKQGTGTVTLDAVNTYTGGTTLTEGTLRVGRAGAIPGSGVTMNGSSASPGKLALNNQNAGNVGQLTLNGYGVIQITKQLDGSNNPTGPVDKVIINGATRIAGKLEIWGWTGSVGQQGYDTIEITGAISGDFLDNVQFFEDDGDTPIGGKGTILNGKLVPTVPEPIEVALGIFGGIFVGFHLLRRYVKRRR